MKTTIISVSTFFFLLFNALAQQPDYTQLRTEAEAQYAQGSYARANEIYSRIDKSKLSTTDVRWVDFRLADTTWRAQSATQTSDTTKLEQSQKQLEELIRVADKEADRDLVWAEAQESLGDLFWTGRSSYNWGGAWPRYQLVLDWWAGQRDVERARSRYLKIIFKAANPPRSDPYYYTSYGNYIPLNVLENALKISTTTNDKAQINFLIAMTMRHIGGDESARQRVPDQFEDALAAGKQTDWYDDALFHYAEWMNNNGSYRPLEDGQWQQRPDYLKALELYRRLIKEFSKGETRYYDQAQYQIKQITDPSLSVGVSNIFLPSSEIEFALNTRNIKRVNLALYKFDLTRDIRFSGLTDEDVGEGEMGPWIQKLPLAGRTPFKSWIKNIDEDEPHVSTGEQVRVEGKLPTGAYLLEAKGGPHTVRDIVLVSDATLVLKSTNKQVLAFFADAITGAPIANANVSLWEGYHRNDKWQWRRLRQTTDSDGLARFALSTVNDHRNLFVTAASNDRQAFVSSYAYATGYNDGWRIYAFTDRPAYRPKETVQWKFIARRLLGGAYSTPANQFLEYEITDPRGTKVHEGKATLNTFGSAWGSLELGEQLPLGEYNIQFFDAGRVRNIGSARLFRLEEYKLPEFKVQVKTPEQDGRRKAFRLGEQVDVEIQADYYFGGPVSSASVEVLVYQKPFYHYWFPRREYGWYYPEFNHWQRPNYGPGSVIKRETIKTDATGKAKLTFDTPRENYSQDYEFRIEARVVDSSRREIIAGDTVRVTRQRYYVYPRPAGNIYRPRDKVSVDINALDANDQPIQTEGTVKVTRDYWWEVWIDPRGREVQGAELRQLKQRSEVFPPLAARGQRPWRLKFRGHQHDDILTQQVKTNGEGIAQFSFTPDREGYYRVAWQSSQGVDTRRDRFLPPVKAETYVFVATNATTDLGYSGNGLEIVVDKDTFRAGQTAPVMISVPVSDRYVLFSVEGDDLFSYKVVHVPGNAKLIELPIEEKHIPNIYLNAAMISDANWYMDQKKVVVPPVQRFLAVAVNADREQYQPREEGTLSVSIKDADNRPVSAEVALGLVDQSVQYIQQEYAGDPRQFYYGNKRQHLVQTRSTLSEKSYAQLVEVQGKLMDRRDIAKDKELDPLTKSEGRISGSDYNAGGGGPGGVAQVSERMATTSLPINGRVFNEPPPPAPQESP